ncbi:hypothetical protein K435DRAFT_909056 [Dendrothele bispora CBS 962.96]|uniref:Uncharacterized protein n=1 Tax=Dendrothele bispora (strain CBS 962.96) TaxID=1314807 RepID=A0A4S8LPQ3_DENBC|nr:hypothetical protein K435DRAFT_909056 [Dendrothele bispora CBS 962.96]
MNPYNAWGSGDAQPPSVFGALPFTQQSGMLVYTFSYNTDVTNSIVLGLGNTAQFEVTTESGRYTLLKTPGAGGRAIALVEWGQPPQVEVRDYVVKQPVSSFLRLSQDRSHRIMFYRNRQFTWVPTGNAISVRFSHHTELLARISQNGRAITLEIAQSAAQAGMLYMCLISTILLQSGRSID